jgi:hypothetical protein
MPTAAAGIESRFFLSPAKTWVQKKMNAQEAAQQKPPGVRHLAGLLLDLHSHLNGGEQP